MAHSCATPPRQPLGTLLLVGPARQTMLNAVHPSRRSFDLYRTFTIFVTLIGAVTGLACSTTTAPQRSKESTVSTPSSPIHFVGRVQLEPSGHAEYAWSGTGFVASFRGTGAAIRMLDAKNEHQAILDGQVLPKILTNKGTERYLIAEGLPRGEHRLEFYRRTEAHFGVTHFLGIDVIDGQLLTARRAPERRIELVGDSISCGYGNEGKDPNCSFSADTENHYHSYGAVLARKLSAELSTVAWSGRGVVKNYNGGDGDKMGQLYERILPETPSSRWLTALPNDLVIVNLGTNDFSTEPDPQEVEFVHGYVALLEQIRRHNPQAYILCTVGPMLGGQDLERAEASIEKAVEARKASGDPRIATHRLKSPNENPGCDWHPSVATHQRMAEELIPIVKTTLGW